MATCPCGSGEADEVCCARYHGGEAAPTARALMRSRYAAYVRGRIDYLVETQDPATRVGLDRAAMAAWSKDTQWMGLEIVEAIGGGERGGGREDEGVVEFVARGVTKGVPFAQRERSRFRKLEGRWYYVDGVAAQAKAAVTAGRNDTCPCGSGVKYKRCHGA